ncbi:cytochrome o ubiquinol oxidase subunit IV [Pantoea sp. Mhis]|uniref:cytochrome o ubiquinol oxidase subunit IV n=1 Tax=Pantoea sp. Mhis TaxID=2576759 RepID=UPI0013567782|nr:cytochrome o ubiquinol oxidase subunit IV [Pantoea sp. Mhis]
MKYIKNKGYKLHNSINDTKRSYLIGFILSIILTIIPFWLVIHGTISYRFTLDITLICAITQILVHLVYFLHLDSKSEDGWNMIAIIFASIIIFIIVVGSLWIMWNLNNNMLKH